MTSFRIRALAIVAMATVAVTWLLAHEGHVALPSRGAQVDAVKGTIVLSRESRSALDVKATEIARQPLPDTLQGYATLEAPWQRHAFASSRLPGRVERLHVRPGQVVAVGQILAEVVGPDLENLQLEAVAAQTEIRLSEQIVAGLRDSPGAVAEQSLLDAETKLIQARHALAVARAKWVGFELSAADFDHLLRDPTKRVTAYPIRSPLSGTVIHADLNLGRVIAAEEHLFEVIDLSRIWAKVGVLEHELRRVAVGQTVELKLTARPGEVFRSTVHTIGLSLDPNTHLDTVWVEFANSAGQEPVLLPGMTGQARILMPVPTDARVVPASALIDDGLAQYVLVEEARAEKQSEYRRRNVSVVRQTNDSAEVRSGELFPGDRVVTQGAHELGGFFIPGVLKLSPEAARTIGLAVAPVGLRAIEEVIELEGHIDLPPESRAAVSVPIAGNVVRIHADRGQTVKAGQVIAEVASVELTSLQLELIREQLSYELLDTQLQRLRRSGTAIPKRRLLDLETEANTTGFRRDNARNRLANWGLSAEQLDALRTTRTLVETVSVRAPITGVVVSVDKVIGQAVKREDPLLSIQDLTRPSVQMSVSEGDARAVKVGQGARVRLLSDPGAVLPGRVARSGQIFTAGDQALAVWVDFDRPPSTQVRFGQLARITLTKATGSERLAVPNEAVLRVGTQSFAFVRGADGAYERRTIVTGRADDSWTETVSGLSPGETIAVGGVPGLAKAYQNLK